MRYLTKSNGSKIRPHSKRDKIKKTTPVYYIGNTASNSKKRHLLRDKIAYKEKEEMKVEQIKEIVYHPIPSYKNKKIITLNTVVLTKEGNKVKITKKNKATTLIYGKLIANMAERPNASV